MATPTRYALWFPQPTLPISPFSTAPVGIAVLLVLISQSLPALIIAACLVALGAYFYYRPPGPFYVELADEDLIIQLIRKTRIPYESIAVAGPARYEAGSTMRTIGNAILKRGNWWGSNYPPFGRKGEINPLAVSMTLTRPAILGFAWPRKRVEIPLEDPTDFLADLSHRIAARVDLLEAPPSALPLERRLLNRLQMAVLALTLVQAALFSIWSLLALAKYLSGACHCWILDHIHCVVRPLAGWQPFEGSLVHFVGPSLSAISPLDFSLSSCTLNLHTGTLTTPDGGNQYFPQSRLTTPDL